MEQQQCALETSRLVQRKRAPESCLSQAGFQERCLFKGRNDRGGTKTSGSWMIGSQNIHLHQPAQILSTQGLHQQRHIHCVLAKREPQLICTHQRGQSQSIGPVAV